MTDSKKIIAKIRQKHILTISRVISQVESSKCDALLSDIYTYIGNAYRIGITGPPGAGKSSITNHLISKFRNANKSVAVIGIDPTSPFSGGALLGDRLRMAQHYSDINVYIRSMASRGSQGGLSYKAQDAANVLDCAGFDVIIYETVGVGQIELDVMKSSDVVMVTLVPEAGDDIQMMKAGLMEIGNIFVINKSDRSGSNKLKTAMQQIFSLKPSQNKWENKIVKTSAINNSGIDELFNSLNDFYKFYRLSGLREKVFKDRYKNQIEEIIKRDYQNNFWNSKRKKMLNLILNEDKSKWPSPLDIADKLKYYE